MTARWPRALAPVSRLLPALVGGLVLALPSAEATARDLSLDEAVQLALEHNPDLVVARFGPDVAAAQQTGSRAGFDTEIYVSAPNALSGSRTAATSDLDGAAAVEAQSAGATAGVRRQFTTGTAVDASLRANRSVTNSAFSTFNPTLSSELALQVVQPLLEGAGQVNRQPIVVAANNRQISEEQLRAAVQDVVLEVCQVYWELVFRRADLEVKAASLALAQEQLARNKEQVRLGSLAPVEMIQAEQAIASAEFQRVQAELALQTAEESVKAVLGVDPAGAGWLDAIVPIDSPSAQVPALEVEQAVQVSLANQPSVRQAQIALDTRGVELAGARNQRLPQLDLVGGLALSGIGGTPREPLSAAARPAEPGAPGDLAGQMFTGDNYRWSLGLSLSVPLHDYAARASLEQASVREQQARAQVQASQQQAAVATQRAVRQLGGQQRAVDAAARARALAEAQLDAEEKKFAMGTATNFQVLQFQRQLAQARTDELRALVDLEIAKANLDRAQGTLLPGRGIALDGAEG